MLTLLQILPPVVTTPQIVTPSQNVEELIKSIDVIIKSLPKIVFAIVFVLVIFIVLIKVITQFYRQTLGKAETIKIGKLILHNAKHQPPCENKETILSDHFGRAMDINSFMNILDIVMTMKIERVVSDSISLSNDVYKIEREYDDRVKCIFSKTFKIIESEFQDKMVQLACDSTGIDMIKIKNTREYFFINYLLREYETIWNEQAKEITRRNGFVEFLEDKTKAKGYISELNDSIYQCIDMGKLESTTIKKLNIEEVVTSCSEKNYIMLEKMFVNLAGLKSNMLVKRQDKLDFIDIKIKDIVKTILQEIYEKIITKDTDCKSFIIPPAAVSIDIVEKK